MAEKDENGLARTNQGEESGESSGKIELHELWFVVYILIELHSCLHVKQNKFIQFYVVYYVVLCMCIYE